MVMKTVMQQHLEWLKSRMTITTKMEKKLLKMEMEQITDAYISSMKNERNLLNIKSAENYYNETYNQDK
jgi:hypothetical protein